MRHPELITAFIKEYQAEKKRLLAERMKKRAGLVKRIDQLEREADRLLDIMVAADTTDMTILNKRKALIAEKMEAELELAQEPEPEKVVDLHPASLKLYEDQLVALEARIGQGLHEDDLEAVEHLRTLIKHVTVLPDETRENVAMLKIRGKLNDLLGVPEDHPSVGGLVVAEEGLEPPTRGL
jgi:site-specific DNA recombinase